MLTMNFGDVLSQSKVRLTLFRIISVMPLFTAVGIGCTTASLDPVSAPQVILPDWTGVPHPAGMDLGDIEAIFIRKAEGPGMSSPPTRQELANCDRPLKVLREKTMSRDEMALGVRELVRADPVGQHWCFYGKILEMEQKLRQPELLLKGRQELVLETFAYLAPVARAFHVELNDSRYWRWAILRYRLASERVFFQKVEPTAETTSTLVTASDPFAWVRPGAKGEGSILQKYGLLPVNTAGAASSTQPPTASSSGVSPPQSDRVGTSVTPPALEEPEALEPSAVDPKPDEASTFPAQEPDLE